MRIFAFGLSLFWLVVPVMAQQAPAVFQLAVSAGEFDRYETVVAFDMPPEADGDAYVLVTEGRDPRPVQVRDGKGWFILDRLPAESTAVFRLLPDVDGAASSAMVEARSVEGAAGFSVGGGAVLTYNFDPTELPRPDIRPVFKRGGYIHPVWTPSGRIITDDYPPNHVHHHGIWAAWTKTAFEGRSPDFWNMGDSTGAVEPVALEETWSGPIHGGFRTHHRYVDFSAETPKTALDETWEVMVYEVHGVERPYWMFDLVQTQTCATESPLALPEYRYGGVGFRGLREWDGAENTFFLTSEGKDRSNGHATQARWCHISGEVAGQSAGIGILGHPDNFRAPQPMRIHPTEPFFNFAPSQAGDWAIEPGSPYVARYRFVVADGDADPAMLDRLWNDYAYPPEITVTPE